MLFATGAAGDPVARGLVDRLGEEVVAMASVALGRLGLLEEEAPVVLGGSVLAARHPLWTTGSPRSSPYAPRRRWSGWSRLPRCSVPRCWGWTTRAPPRRRTTVLRAQYA